MEKPKLYKVHMINRDLGMKAFIHVNLKVLAISPHEECELHSTDRWFINLNLIFTYCIIIECCVKEGSTSIAKFLDSKFVLVEHNFFHLENG